jgi:hypothetical protein
MKAAGRGEGVADVQGWVGGVRSGRAALAALAAVLLLSACADRGEVVSLKQLRSPHDGPDEFAIVPPRPLELPKDMTALPDPTPGGENRTDQRPLDAAVSALGGRPGAGGSDGALVAATTRFGIEPGVREALASEDERIRRRNKPRLLERIFSTNVYNRAYERQQVRQYPELERWRASGRRTPAAPPDPRYWRPDR